MYVHSYLLPYVYPHSHKYIPKAEKKNVSLYVHNNIKNKTKGGMSSVRVAAC